jgi:hypothetical protein
MKDLNNDPAVQGQTDEDVPSNSDRRGFFKKMAGATGVAVAASGCDTLFDLPDDPADAVTLDFSNDFGVLNFAYALEQLEAAFYAEVVSSIDSGELTFSRSSRGIRVAAGKSARLVHGEYFRAITAHERIHRDFLAAAIPANGGTAIPALEVDFSSVDFSDSTSVLQTARTLEDTGVSAYNGAGDMLESATFLKLAGKIVSVEARHASAVRSLIEPMSENFADLSELTSLGADPDAGYDAAMGPDQVLSATDPFIKTPITTENVSA